MKTTGIVVLAVSVVSSFSAFAQHAYQGADKGYAAPSQDIRQPSAGGSGEDVCMKWNLSEADLKSCRQQWMEAKTEADRLAVRDRYGANTGLKGQLTEHEGAPHPDNSNACDTLKLKAADKTECRAEWKSARNEQARQATIKRYKAVAAGDKAGSRQEPAPERDKSNNGGPPAAE